MPLPQNPDLADLIVDDILTARKSGPLFRDQLTELVRKRLPVTTPAEAPKDFGDRKKIPPTPAQVEAYSASIGYPLNGQAWCDSYATKGWLVGKAKMKDWQACVRTWKTNDYGSRGVRKTPGGDKPATL